MYMFYLDGVLLPLAPPSMQIQTPGKNQTIELIDGSEINVLKKPGLKTIAFEIMIPVVEYDFCVYEDGFKPATYFLDKLEKLKDMTDTGFQFIVVRTKATPNGQMNTLQYDESFYSNTNIKVSLEDLQVNEDAEQGPDFSVSLTLKEYVDYSAKEMVIQTNTTTGETEGAPTEPERPLDSDHSDTSGAKRYTVQEGDCLWAICGRELGDSTKCWAVAELNNIADPDLIYPDQVLDLNVV